MPDHVHMMLALPPKYAVSQMVGFIKGRSSSRTRRKRTNDWINSACGDEQPPIGGP